ncbi:MAG: BolA family transcriptional regulator [Betaproteobacteria bacterium]|nr:BolA family transcriptional regulator [Betaproteobacteria bacterium]
MRPASTRGSRSSRSARPSRSDSDLDLRDDSDRHAGHAGSNGGGHLTVRIVSPQFDGLGTVARHRKVYSVVHDLMPTRLHALAITALTPAEAGL